MKRLLIASFLVITSVTIFALTNRSAVRIDCSDKTICCKKPAKPTVAPDNGTDYIFWQPVNRLMSIQH
jgi:hypothetical protein